MWPKLHTPHTYRTQINTHHTHTHTHTHTRLKGKGGGLQNKPCPIRDGSHCHTSVLGDDEVLSPTPCSENNPTQVPQLRYK